MQVSVHRDGMRQAEVLTLPSDSPWPRWQALWALTRPGFLSVSISAALVGLAQHASLQTPLLLKTALVLVLVTLAHAAINAWNDVHDARSGADASNHGRLAPFCGGSRALQEGGLNLSDAQRLVWVLVALVIAGGLTLTALSQRGVLWVGLLGLFLGWAYSAPPLALMRRGWGELTVALCWSLIPIGAHLALGGTLHVQLMLIALGPAVGACSILVIANVADLQADADNGKRTLVVRLGAARALHGFIVLQAGLWALLAFAVWNAHWPQLSLLTLLALPLSLYAIRLARQSCYQRVPLKGAIAAAIQTSLIYNLALAIGLGLG